MEGVAIVHRFIALYKHNSNAFAILSIIQILYNLV